MKKISKKKQKEMLASVSPAVYAHVYNGQEIEINPALTIEQRKAFCEGVWSLYWNADKEGNFDYRPFLYDTAIRMMTLYLYTNLDIVLELSEANMALIQYSDAYESVISSLPEFYARDHSALCGAAKEYVDRKCTELNSMLSNAAKSEIDMLVGGLLIKVSSILDKMDVDMEKYAEAGKEFPLQEILPMIKKFTEFNNSEGVVNNILDFRDRKAEGTQDGGPTVEV